MSRLIEPGIFYDMTADEYFADPCPAPSFTQSLAKLVLEQSTLHAMHQHPKLAPNREDDDEEEKYTRAKAIGNAVHTTLIGRGKKLAIGEFDNFKKKAAKEFRDDAYAAGMEPILRKHMTEAENVVTAVRVQVQRAGWANAFCLGKGEAVACWQENGLWFRTMIDWITPDMRECYDAKTTEASFAPHIIGRKMVADGWDVQAAMHERALDAIDPNGAGRRKFRYVAIENYPPYAMVPVEMTETWLTMGRKKLAVAIDQWRAAMATGKFAGYPLEPCRPEYPGYAENAWLGRELGEFAREDHQNERPQRSADYIQAG